MEATRMQEHYVSLTGSTTNARKIFKNISPNLFPVAGMQQVKIRTKKRQFQGPNSNRMHYL